MKKHFTITSLLLLISCLLQAQNIKIFYENKSKGFILYATNSEVYAVSTLFSLDLSNMTFSEGDKTIFVVPAKAEKYKIGELTAEGNSRYTFSFKYKAVMGDVNITDYNKEYEYDLPFQKGKSYNVFQGYHGSFSHQTENALDFTMPEGSEILAARDGMVVQVVQNNTESCPKEECMKYNNYITVMHSDGTFASYVHIKFNGARYKVGDAVKKGDVIAYSGNVGWSSGPHLHFVCFLTQFEKRNTLETKFKISDGNLIVPLKEKTTYTRSY